jgi:RNA polymerase sigma-70 factor (sigma-E family)
MASAMQEPSHTPAAPGGLRVRAGADQPAPDRDEAMRELYHAHYQSLVRIATMLLRDTGAAEEVTQDAFVAMHKAWPRLRNSDKALAYLRQSVVNGARSLVRRRVVADKYIPPAPLNAPGAEEAAFAVLERADVVTALRGLPARQREVLVLRYYVDLSEAEIAQIMRISRGAVKSHASRGIAALRLALAVPSYPRAA